MALKNSTSFELCLRNKGTQQLIRCINIYKYQLRIWMLIHVYHCYTSLAGSLLLSWEKGSTEELIYFEFENLNNCISVISQSSFILSCLTKSCLLFILTDPELKFKRPPVLNKDISAKPQIQNERLFSSKRISFKRLCN